MPHYVLSLTLLAASGPALALTPSAPLVLPAPLPVAVAAAAAQEMPMRYVGEGLTVVVKSFNESTMKAEGTVQLGTGAALPFWIDLTAKSDGTQTGKGKVTDGKFARRIKTKESLDGTVTVTYRAKRYDVTLQTGKVTPEVEGPARDVVPTPGKTQSESSAKPKSTIRLRKHTFKDPKLNNMPSHTILVPDGWTATGGAFWFPDAYFKLMPSQEIKVASPEGVSVQIDATFTARDTLPPRGSGMARPREGTSEDGFPVLYMPGDLEAWKSLVLKRVLPDAHPKATNLRVADVQIIPDLTQMLHRELASEKAQIAQDNRMTQQMDMVSSVDAWALGFECYFTEGGKEYEEFRMSVVVARTNEGSFIGKTTMWNQVRGIALTAPKGQLEAELPLLMSVMGSLQETEPWMRNRAQLMASINKISHQVAMNNLKESAKRSQIMSAANSEANSISRAGYRSRNASSDRSHQGTMNAINETEFYSVPGSSTQVQLPSGYSNVYSNGAGEYFLTNDALFNPTKDLEGGSWTAMKTK